MAMQLNINHFPGWVPYLHQVAQKGNADLYRETPNQVFVKVHPLPIDGEHFPYLKDVDEVWLVYRRSDCA
jgi:hypothetical protein